MRRGALLLAPVLMLMTGCATQPTTPVNNTTKVPVSHTVKNVMTLSKPKFSVKGQDVTVVVFMTNKTDMSRPLQASKFVLISGTHVFSPTNSSQIPSQIPANSKAQISLVFDTSHQLSGSVSARLAFQPSSNQPEEFLQLGAIKIPKITTVASKPPGPTVTFINNDGSSVTLPVIGLKATYGVSFSTPPPLDPVEQIPPIHYNIPADQASELSAYWANEGYQNQGILFLAPRRWVPTSAAIGADGSEVFSLQSPSAIQQKFTLADDGGCAGCAVTDIGAYFPSMQKWVAAQGMPVGTGSGPDFQSEHPLNVSTMAYSLVSFTPGYQTNGVAYMNTSGNTFFGHEEVTLPSAQHGLETTILNFYTAYTITRFPK